MYKLLNLLLLVTILSGCLYKEPDPDAIPKINANRPHKREDAVDMKELSTKKVIEL
jgi:hypothetical protein